MKLWDKGISVHQKIDAFTVGKDRALDVLLAPYDVIGSKAHANMLSSVGIITKEDNNSLQKALDDFLLLSQKKDFVIEPEYEDIHSKIEDYLTEKCGNAGKKIHTARSRNDQVLTAIQLFNKEYLKRITQKIISLVEILLQKAEEHKEDLLPGYTHFQAGMPSSFGLWFLGYAENLILDLEYFETAYKIADQNPLGSGAGYGSSFPIDREQTTKEMGFGNLLVASTSAQILRGRLERTVAIALNMVCATLGKLSYDLVWYNSQDLGFVVLPTEMTTGSSIMPHKKNPDVFELCRAQCNGLQSVIGNISMASSNLPSGYHRDFQYLKELIMEPMMKFEDIIEILLFSIPQLKVNANILGKDKYDKLFTVESINKLMASGVTFRDAYKEIGKQVNEGKYKSDRQFKTTHTGSVHNLGTHLVAEKLNQFKINFL